MTKIMLSSVALLCTSTLWAVSDSGECSGSETFKQTIEKGSVVTVDTLPQGLEGLVINLQSEVDIDIQLDGDRTTKVVNYDGGILHSATVQTRAYRGTNFVYSGYAGINRHSGNESVMVTGQTRTQLTLKVAAFQGGDATVEYSWTGRAGCGTDDNNTDDNNTDGDTIIYDGLEYRPVTSPRTGRVWLDRNMGAKQACESEEDTECYGDYYQWGRGADGHQLHNSESSINLLSAKLSRLTADEKFELLLRKELSSVFKVPFVSSVFSRINYDWINLENSISIRQDYWAKTDGSYICPTEYRVPTGEEFAAERDYTFLNIPYAGYRSGGGSGSQIQSANSLAQFWTNSVRENDNYEVSTSYYFYGSIKGLDENRQRTYGLSVRCIKD